MLWNRPFLLLWSAQAISQTAQNIITFALIIEVEQLSHSSTQVSLVVLSFTVPAVVVGPIAGVFVDRTDKRSVLAVTNLLRTLAVPAYIIVNPGWPLPTALLTIFLLSAFFSTISQFFAPAEAATIPLLVGREQLARANSLFSLTYTTSQVAGFALFGPLLIKLTTANNLFVVVSLLYLVCTLLVALLPPLPHALRARPTGGLMLALRLTARDIYEQWRFITSEPTVSTAMTDIAITTSIFLMLGTLGVGLLTRVIGLPANDLAFILAAGGIGLGLGLLLVPRVIKHIYGRRLIEIGLIAEGGTILGMSLVSMASSLLLGWLDAPLRAALTVAVVALLATGLGIGSAFVTIPAQTLLQESTPPSLRGRVFATLFAFSGALSILPVFFAGALADQIGLQQVMMLIGTGTLALAAVGHYRRVL
ncbi:MAG: MFS transporter [Chloroflexi bacterium]|nr:MFS transporter [Chloroflexota bacterium]